jgi:hypothetical protein
MDGADRTWTKGAGDGHFHAHDQDLILRSFTQFCGRCGLEEEFERFDQFGNMVCPDLWNASMCWRKATRI